MEKRLILRSKFKIDNIIIKTSRNSPLCGLKSLYVEGIFYVFCKILILRIIQYGWCTLSLDIQMHNA